MFGNSTRKKRACDFNEECYTPEDYYRQLQTDVSPPNYQCFNQFQNVSNAEAERFTYNQKRSVMDDMEQQKYDWNIKAQRYEKEKRHVAIKSILLSVSLVSCFAGTLLRFTMGVQFILYVILIGMIAATDPVGAVGRFLALPSRILICCDCVCIVLFSLTKRFDVAVLAFVVITLSVFLIKALNSAWLSADCWRDTNAVEKALKRDPEGLGGRAWQAQGKREVRTALIKLGLNDDENALDYCHRVSFEIGYSLGIDKAENLKAAAASLEQMQKELYQSSNRVKQLENEIEDNQEEISRLQAWQQSEQATGDYYKKLYAKTLKENEQLQCTNEELLNSCTDIDREERPSSNVIDIPNLKIVKSDKEIVLDALNQGYSYKQAAELAGISKSKAYRLGEDYRKPALKKVMEN